MNTAQIDAAKFETITFSQSETVVRSAGWRSTAQFWSSVILSSFLLVHGAWLLTSANRLSPESLERQGSVLIAVVYGMMLPSFVYFAWKAWRQGKSEQTVTIER